MNDPSRPTPASVLEAAARSAARGSEEASTAGLRRIERFGVGALVTIVCTALWTAVLDDRPTPARPIERPAAALSGAALPRADLEGARSSDPGTERPRELCPGEARPLDGVAAHEGLPAHAPGTARVRKTHGARSSALPARARTKGRASPLKPNPY